MSVESKRSHVVDLSRPGGGVTVEVDAAEAAEVLMSVCSLTSEPRDSYDLGEERLRAIEAAADPGLLAAVAEIGGGEKVLAHLLGLVYETAPPRTFAAFLERVDASDPLDLQLLLLGYHMRDYHVDAPPETIRAAASGDEAARARLLDAVAEWAPARQAAEALLALGADGIKQRLLELLPRWYDEIFRPLAAEAMDAAERDAESKRKLLSGRSVEEIVELVTNGVQYTPGPEIRKVVLFPTYWLRPWVMFMNHKDVRIFAYPVVDPVESDAPSAAQLARIFKALGDEGRLTILRALSDRPLGLGEAAELLGVAKSTAHHHLSILRAAGLVLVRDEPEKVYTLRTDLLPQAGALLNTYLQAR
jgi:DNA-binding transcriptional ArsR family regulator